MAASAPERTYNTARRGLNHQRRIERVEDALDKGFKNEVLSKASDAPWDLYWRDVGDVLDDEGAIRFDTFPQDDDWLYVKTTGQNPDSTFSAGIEFVARGNEVTPGILVLDAANILLDASATGRDDYSAGQITLDAGAGDVQVTSGYETHNATGSVELYTGGFFVDAGSAGFFNSFIGIDNGVQIGADSGDVTIALQPSYKFLVRNTFSAAEEDLFIVDEDGNLFGTSLTGDADFHYLTGLFRVLSDALTLDTNTDLQMFANDWLANVVETIDFIAGTSIMLETSSYNGGPSVFIDNASGDLIMQTGLTGFGGPGQIAMYGDNPGADALYVGLNGYGHLAADSWDIQGGASGNVSILRQEGELHLTGTDVLSLASTAIWLGSAGQSIGFFGVTPVTQPATPVTLADVIAALQALGLVA